MSRESWNRWTTCSAAGSLVPRHSRPGPQRATGSVRRFARLPPPVLPGSPSVHIWHEPSRDWLARSHRRCRARLPGAASFETLIRRGARRVDRREATAWKTEPADRRYRCALTSPPSGSRRRRVPAPLFGARVRDLATGSRGWARAYRHRGRSQPCARTTSREWRTRASHTPRRRMRRRHDGRDHLDRPGATKSGDRGATAHVIGFRCSSARRRSPRGAPDPVFQQ